MQMGSAMGLARWQLQSLLVRLGCTVVPKITIGILGPQPFGWVERAQPNRACHRVASKLVGWDAPSQVTVCGGGTGRRYSTFGGGVGPSPSRGAGPRSGYPGKGAMQLGRPFAGREVELGGRARRPAMGLLPVWVSR